MSIYTGGILCLAGLVSNVAWAQSSGSFSPLSNTIATPRPFDPGSNTTNPSALAIQSQNPYLGSVPVQPLVPGNLPLSMREAVSLALRANLGLIDSEQAHAQSRASRMKALSALLPQLSAEATQNFGNYSLNMIGGQKLGLPSMIPMFSYQTAQLRYTQSLFDMSARHEVKAAANEEQESAAMLADARNIVVLAASSAYLQVVASQSRVAVAQAELQSAIALDTLIRDRVRREVSPEIDSIRARVSRQTAEQRLALAQARLEKDKLALTRIAGLQVEQAFTLTDTPAYTPAPAETVDTLIARAEQERNDLKAAEARVKFAQQKVSANSSQRLPVLEVRADGGGVGVNASHFYGDYMVEGSVSIPLFTGRRIEAEVASARANLHRREAELEDLRARTKYDVRSALFDLQAAEKGVQVAIGNLQLAQEGLKQAKDRFEAGVSNSIELIQAEQAWAEAEDNNIASIYAHNLAKLMLIRSTGTAEQHYSDYLGVR